MVKVEGKYITVGHLFNRETTKKTIALKIQKHLQKHLTQHSHADGEQHSKVHECKTLTMVDQLQVNIEEQVKKKKEKIEQKQALKELLYGDKRGSNDAFYHVYD